MLILESKLGSSTLSSTLVKYKYLIKNCINQNSLSVNVTVSLMSQEKEHYNVLRQMELLAFHYIVAMLKTKNRLIFACYMWRFRHEP